MRYQVQYKRFFPEWHEKASPQVIDTMRKKNNEYLVVLWPEQFVGHCGEYDAEAERLCLTACAALNAAENP